MTWDKGAGKYCFIGPRLRDADIKILTKQIHVLSNYRLFKTYEKGKNGLQRNIGQGNGCRGKGEG